ncbi:MAG: hypothetical protein AMXMBFR34_25440 [Myxococcaceae bacterium]
MTSRTSRAVAPSPYRPVTFDLGPDLLRAVRNIGPTTDNPTINSLASSLESSLATRGMRNGWVKELLFQVRGAQQGVTGDAARFAANVKRARSLGVLGPNGAAQLLSKLGVASAQAENQRQLDNSFLNVNNQRTVRPRSSSKFESPLLQASNTSSRVDTFTSNRKAAASQPRPAARPDAPRVSPALERALKATDTLAKGVPQGPLKAALEAVSSALNLAKTAQEKGRPLDYAKAVSELGEKTVTLVAETIKVAASDPQLAEAAARQLGMVARVFGKVAGPLKSIDAAVRLVTGKTLGGAPVDANGRADALVDLASSVMPPPIQAAVGISKATLEALYTHVGLEVKRATEEHGLRQLFGGRTPQQMKALIEQLPTDAANANATVARLLRSSGDGLFRNTTSGYSQATAHALWRKSMSVSLRGDAQTLEAMLQQRPGKPNSVPDELREVMASRMKAAALRFVEQQVRDAKGSW